MKTSSHILITTLLFTTNAWSLEKNIVLENQIKQLEKINQFEIVSCPDERTFNQNEPKKILTDQCNSGVELGLSKNSQKTHWSHENGGEVKGYYSKLESPSYYNKRVNGKVIEVTDNIYYKELLEKYPELEYPKTRLDSFSIKENIPKIENLVYEKDDFDEQITPKRGWSYDFFGQTGTQSLMVTDNPLRVFRDKNGKITRTQEQDSPKLMRSFEFFPRSSAPKVELGPDKTNPQKIILTLSNGEKVTYDAKTGALMGGAFTKSKKAKKDYDKGMYYYNPDEYTYTGSGVWIEAIESEKNGYSRRAENKQGQLNYVYIKKNNPYRECKVPSKDLWETQSGQRSTKEEYIKFEKAKGVTNPSEYGHLNTSYTCFFFKFKTDKEFAKYLQKKCGFDLN